jgi:acyl carrier protein
MELLKFIENFSNEFLETDVNEIKGETKFKNLEEWDSVLALSIIAMVEENYNRRITGNELRNSETVYGLFINIFGSNIE